MLKWSLGVNWIPEFTWLIEHILIGSLIESNVLLRGWRSQLASRFRSMELFHRCHKWASFFNFPVSRALGRRLKGRPGKKCAILLAVTLWITCKSGCVEHKQHVGGKVQTQNDRRNEKRTYCKCTKKWRKKFLRHKNTQVGARRENAMFLRFTRARTFEMQEVENLAARSYECYVRDLTWQNVNNRFNRVWYGDTGST